jgi:hypothetical protein
MGFEEIRYLAHNTSVRNLAGIVRDGALLTEYDMWRRKKRAGRSSFQLSDAFPGVFMSWHLGGEHVSLFYGTVTLIFGRDLVRRQRNFHLNLADKNGYLIEQGTFFQGDEGIPNLASAQEFMVRHGDPKRRYPRAPRDREEDRGVHGVQRHLPSGLSGVRKAMRRVRGG